VTLAFWCILVAALAPYAPLGLTTRNLDPKLPRKRVPDLEGLAARAYGAHLNAFEAFPPFAAAVVVSHIVEGASAIADALAVVFVLARAAHMAFYLLDRQPARSAAFFVGLLATIAIFVQPAFR
jgi:uncharacterized MAPEG superfamily protein